MPEVDEDFYRDDPAPLVRKEFVAPEWVARARLYIAGLSYYEGSINGRRGATTSWTPAGRITRNGSSTASTT